MIRRLLFVALLLLVACEGGSLPDAARVLDAGHDARPTDAGALDAGALDAGPLDAGALDAAPVDAPDAAPIDGAPPDADLPDAAPVDAAPCLAAPDGLDRCNGIDDDCDPATADGAEDPLVDLACDPGIGALCTGHTTCSLGAVVCALDILLEPEACNALDDDCDGVVDEGFDLGVPCDGTDSDLCEDDVTACADSGAATVCAELEPDAIDLCNGLDDDCDPASADGAEDPSVGAACDGPDADLCAEGTRACVAGALVCNDSSTDTPDLCNEIDDDCDPTTADGVDAPGAGAPCDGVDADLCAEGVLACSVGALACSDATIDTPDLCNGLDDDCDPASADGSEDLAPGAACDGPDSDHCSEGVASCTAGVFACSDTSDSTIDLCNGLDDDCDPASADGAEDPGAGAACDGPDTDRCAEGVIACTAAVLRCADATGDSAEFCNGVDDDCDPATVDGAFDPGVGAPCDGPDTDLCNEGVRSCTGGALACSDTTSNRRDVCNGLDDDCDAASSDGSEDVHIGIACDGPDSDRCIEGLQACTAGAITCTDATPASLDICNGLDDDCDAASADGAEDPGAGDICDGPDGDLCGEGVLTCLGGAIVCNDFTDDILDICNGLDDDCDDESPDGSEEPGLGGPCDGPDFDRCDEGLLTCALGVRACSDTTADTFDLCNGLDDDCDPDSADGAEDPGIGAPCDGPDSDLCVEGTQACLGGGISCDDFGTDTLDLCNGLDDDCDPASADGTEDPGVGAACDGPDADLCAEGARSCSGGSFACSDATGATLDLCNGFDDDCDPASADGTEDPGIGAACDGPDGDLCAEGTQACVTGALTCNDATGDRLDLCNGLNDDCDAASADGAEDPALGSECDGADSDLCAEGTRSCPGGAFACSDVTAATLDLCNTLDDDCDPASTDGAEDPGVGAACDGPDADLCAEGAQSCGNGAIACNDATGDRLDLCNGLDDDCDVASADGAEDPGLGSSCDGADSDLCAEGTRSCASGAFACSDATTATLDLCNTLDDDCDPASADGAEDPGLGVACDGADSDLCAEGPQLCFEGALGCSDLTGDTLDLCNGLNDDCDAASADGAEDARIDAPCDGADADLCDEGLATCATGVLFCSDATGNLLDLCNEVDDDCDSASPDGAEDPGVGAACDGADSDLCAEGTQSCTGGAISCSDLSSDTLDLCSGLDDDCDAASADGSEDVRIGAPCDGVDSDRCDEGVATCVTGALVCSDATVDSIDLCNLLDDDCDPASADGSEDPGLGAPCDGADADLCLEGTQACVTGLFECSDVTGSTIDLCNLLDDDCDPASADGTEDVRIGAPCDGTDADLCAEGVAACVAGAVACSDATFNSIDTCNGLDDDCDPASADGSEEPGLGAPCDGADSDLCLEGTQACVTGLFECSDVTSDTVDLCNLLDDDCDPGSADGDEDPLVGAACDGPDSDLCLEGVTFCLAGARACTDTTFNSFDLCDGTDDDCDPASADGSEDPGLGAPCDGADSDLCREGVVVCDLGATGCSDLTPSVIDVCNALDDDCDPASTDGSEDPLQDSACDGPDVDLCTEGARFCLAGALLCSDATGDAQDACNGLDDDCDSGTVDGSADPAVGPGCDGSDSDFCVEGSFVCAAGAVLCDDNTASEVDLCNGVNDDCDPASSDGAEDPANGTNCDGADTDLCLEATRFCAGGTLQCGDLTSDNMETCNSNDDDCNPATVDGTDEPGFGSPCDGIDFDRCAEGTLACAVGEYGCTDLTGTTVDLCNGLDDDCDPSSVDGQEDPQLSVPCDGPDADLCTEGVLYCSAGIFECDDATGDILDVCDGDDNDCAPLTPDGAGDGRVGTSCDGTDGDRCEEGTNSCLGASIQCDDFTSTLVELCNGADDDCNSATPDGVGDPALGTACDGGDLDFCAEGTYSCPGGTLDCTDFTGNSNDNCNAVDDDCNPATPDGYDEPALGGACDGPDADGCAEGALLCVSGAMACNDTTGDTPDLCDASDNDCTPSTPDGAHDPAVSVPCDGTDTDLCESGLIVCDVGSFICTDDPAVDVCP